MAHLEAKTSMGNKKVLCRLCLRHEQPVANIFEKMRDLKNGPTFTLAERLFDVLNVKFNHSTKLPSNICQYCYSKMEEYRDIRETVRIREKELQNWLQKADQNSTRTWADQTAGLNGNPGVFIPGPNCTIIEVDPEQEYENSDDEWMESDSNDEDMSITASPKPKNVSEQPSHPPMQMESVESSKDYESSKNASSQKTDSDVPCEMSPSPPAAVSSTQKLYVSEKVGLGTIMKHTFLCKFCEMAFATNEECGQHESRHDRTAPYNCALCSMRTISRQFLISHVKERHDSEKPFICTVCKRGFNRRSDLRKHAVIHTGVRPFTCPVCDKSFSRSASLKKHIGIHKSAKPHVCPHCPCSFSTVREKIRHAGTHSSEKPFKCSRCPSSYTRRYKLRRHEAKHHSHESDAAGTSVTGTKKSHNQIALEPTDAPAPKQDQPQNLLACKVCKKEFLHLRNLQSHEELHQDKRSTCNRLH